MLKKKKAPKKVKKNSRIVYKVVTAIALIVVFAEFLSTSVPWDDAPEEGILGMKTLLAIDSGKEALLSEKEQSLKRDIEAKEAEEKDITEKITDLDKSFGSDDGERGEKLRQQEEKKRLLEEKEELKRRQALERAEAKQAEYEQEMQEREEEKKRLLEEKIRALTKDKKETVEVTKEGVKTKLENKEDGLVIKAEFEDGTEKELEQETKEKIDARLEISGIKVATSSANKFVLEKSGIKAFTDYALVLDLSANKLLVNAPSGQKEVAVLPDEVVSDAISEDNISTLLVDEEEGGPVRIIEVNGGLVYEVSGLKSEKLLGFVPVLIEKNIRVSAEDGAVKSESSPIFHRVLDLLAF